MLWELDWAPAFLASRTYTGTLSVDSLKAPDEFTLLQY